MNKRLPVVLSASALASVLLFAATARPQVAAPASHSWEHLAMPVPIDDDLGLGADVSRKINQLGVDGWQLVDVENFLAGGKTSQTIYYFKRPK